MYIRYLPHISLMYQVVDQLNDRSVVDAGLNLVHLFVGIRRHHIDGTRYVFFFFVIEEFDVFVIPFNSIEDTFLSRQDYDGLHFGAHLNVFEDAHFLGI